MISYDIQIARALFRPFIRNRRTWFMKPAFEPQMWVRMTRCGSVLTGSSYLWKGCSWREPGAPRTQAPERRRSELQHPPTPGRVRERRTEIDIKRSGTISFTTSGMLLPAVVHFKANKHSISTTDSIHVVPLYSSKMFVFSCSRSDSSVFDFFFFPSRELLCQSHRDPAGRQLYTGRSEEELPFGVKKKRAALDIGEWDRKRGPLLMGRKSKPIMHLIILLCGLFMHLISSHPYSPSERKHSHVFSKQPRRAGRGRWGRFVDLK